MTTDDANDIWIGSCLCGAIDYRIDTAVDGALLGINYCHCRQCQKASGTAFATSLGVKKAAFLLNDAKGRLCYFESSAQKRRYFCGNCGTPLYSHASSSADRVYVRMGTLDGTRDRGADAKKRLRPQVHIHVASKAPWYPINDGLAQLEHEDGLDF